jgi:hypothetical protein
MRIEDELESRMKAYCADAHNPVFVAMPISEFEREVLDRLGQLQAKVDMLVGNGQPGRVALVEEKLRALERNDIRRSVYDRLVSAAVAFFVSVAIALHEHLGLK